MTGIEPEAAVKIMLFWQGGAANTAGPALCVGVALEQTIVFL
jgi:hypothetical protein